MWWKWIGWAARLVATALLLSFLCIWTTGYIVNSYVQTALKQFDIPLETKPFALSGIWGTLWGSGGGKAEDLAAAGLKPSPTPSLRPAPTPTPDGTPAPTPTPAPTSDPAAASPEPGPTPPGQPEGSAGETGAGAQDPNEAVPVWNGGESGGGAAISDEEKQKLYSIVVSKLSSDQLQELTGYLNDGLTAEELPKVQALLKGALTEQEYKQMMDMLNPPSDAAAQ
ncbi:hypothetical protein [Cohnella nanjingensis]|uniref:Spore coat protein n=1 Tax=Cohnella nanjingensis TaxID=1387779 RepID=A0A7X0VIB5_9BACL|nr:hypothetical protein [Cohnella nanjingensis]MBB6674363.1 hypothetical protein [Cohnella nanjingensis]